jgi:hypothetical protein
VKTCLNRTLDKEEFCLIWKLDNVAIQEIVVHLTCKHLYSYESEFLQKLVKDKKIHEARAFNFTCRYIDDVLSINNSRFAEFQSWILKLKSSRLS